MRNSLLTINKCLYIVLKKSFAEVLLKEEAVAIKASHKHFEDPHFPVHVLEDGVMFENVEQGFHAKNAAASGMI